MILKKALTDWYWLNFGIQFQFQFRHLAMEFFEISDGNGIRTVKINNPAKKNAMGNPAYLELGRILNTAADDDRVKCIVITGKGDIFW